LGSIGQRHARNLRKLFGGGVRLIAYRSRGTSPVVADGLTADVGRSVDEEYGLESVYSLDEALERSPNVAFVCNPTSLHLDAAVACARAGCDLFIEKPVADTTDGLDQLVDLVNDKRLVVGVGCQLRFHPALVLLNERIGDGSIGRPLAARAEVGEYLPDWHPYEDYRDSYAARRSLGGGVILTLIHEIDYLTWLFGVPKHVFAVGGHLSSLDIDVEDVASVLARCDVDGRPFPVHLQLDYLRRPPRRTCAVLGESGALDLDLRRNRLTLTSTTGTETTLFDEPSLDRNELFVAELADFMSARSRREAPRVSLAAGIAGLRVALAARESIQSGNRVEIE
jgi:predicted dehydrogenase